VLMDRAGSAQQRKEISAKSSQKKNLSKGQ
jgi:hypothetical protein